MTFYNPPSKPSGIGSLMDALAKTQKRKAYFAFHFDDIMRVNNIRNAWKIDHPDSLLMRSFYDSSLWESRQLEGPESLKKLIREGVEHTSAICVLAGSETWSRRWVRYEIARAVIDGRGLLAVHLNNLKHHQRLQADPLGPNPLDYMAVGKVQADQNTNALAILSRIPPSVIGHETYYLFEWTGKQWDRYQDYTWPVKLPGYLADPAPGYVTQLSQGTAVYDYVNDLGHKNIGSWIDLAARQVGR